MGDAASTSSITNITFSKPRDTGSSSPSTENFWSNTMSISSCRDASQRIARKRKSQCPLQQYPTLSAAIVSQSLFNSRVIVQADIDKGVAQASRHGEQPYCARRGKVPGGTYRASTSDRPSCRLGQNAATCGGKSFRDHPRPEHESTEGSKRSDSPFTIKSHVTNVARKRISLQHGADDEQPKTGQARQPNERQRV